MAKLKFSEDVLRIIEEELEECNKTKYPSKHWENFFNKFKEIETLKVSQWKDVHIISYICKLFKEKFDRDFVVTIKGTAPSKSPDMFVIKQIYLSLNTTNPKIIKDYIDWCFENKINSPFRKLGFFLTSGFVNEFNNSTFLKKNSISRSTEMPKEYLDICSQFEIDINTFGDLAFVYAATKNNKDTSSNYFLLLKNIEALGFDLNKLENIGDK